MPLFTAVRTRTSQIEASKRPHGQRVLCLMHMPVLWMISSLVFVGLENAHCTTGCANIARVTDLWAVHMNTRRLLEYNVVFCVCFQHDRIVNGGRFVVDDQSGTTDAIYSEWPTPVSVCVFRMSVCDISLAAT